MNTATHPDPSVMEKLQEIAQTGLAKAQEFAHRASDLTVGIAAFAEAMLLEHAAAGHSIDEATPASLAVAFAAVYLKRRLMEADGPDAAPFDWDSAGAPSLSELDAPEAAGPAELGQGDGIDL
jgi:hypothetical protein